MCTKFQLKRTTLAFLAQICPKKKLGFEIQKTNVGIRIGILEIPYVPIFRQNGQLWVFGPKFAQKWILGLTFQKSKSGFGINTSKIPCVPIFSQNGQLLIFRSELRKLHNYMQYFGSNIVEGGGWSWVMEMGAWFSNTSSENRRWTCIFSALA